MDQYPVIDVSDWEITHDEPEGKDEKHWCREPGTDTEWIFKRVAPDRPGSHWAEKMAGEVARTLRVPAAAIQLATYQGAFGVISRDARPNRTWDHHVGAVLLEELDPAMGSTSGGFLTRCSPTFTKSDVEARME